MTYMTRITTKTMQKPRSDYDVTSITVIKLGKDEFTEECGMSNNRIELQYAKVANGNNNYIYALYEGCSGIDYHNFDTKEDLLVYLDKMDNLFKTIYPDAAEEISAGIEELFGFEINE